MISPALASGLSGNHLLQIPQERVKPLVGTVDSRTRASSLCCVPLSFNVSEQRPLAFGGPCAQAHCKDRMVINTVNISPAEGEWTALPFLWMRGLHPCPMVIAAASGLRGQRETQGHVDVSSGRHVCGPVIRPQGMNRVSSPLSGAHWPPERTRVSGQL